MSAAQSASAELAAHEFARLFDTRQRMLQRLARARGRRELRPIAAAVLNDRVRYFPGAPW